MSSRSIVLALLSISLANSQKIWSKLADYNSTPKAAQGKIDAPVPVARTCGPDTADIVCIERYGSLLPSSFQRNPSPFTTYSDNMTDPSDPSWALVARADFVIFDKQRGLDILGDTPSVRLVFNVSEVIHEGPTYVPAQNKLYFSQVGPPGALHQYVVDLNHEPPTLSQFLTAPPMYAPLGSWYHNGMVYWAVSGNNASLPDGQIQRPGIARMDPVTKKVEMLIDNYYGFYFVGPNDLTIDEIGDIWFTDDEYGYILGVSEHAPMIGMATWRFRPSTGEIQIVEDSLVYPNGIAFSPDGKTLYLGDSSFENYAPTPNRGPGNFYGYPIEIEFNNTLRRNLFAFDVIRPSNSNPYLANKRVIWQSLEGAPDGMKVAANGYIVAAGGLETGVDILGPDGSQIARIQTTHAVENFIWAGPNLTTLWMTGIGGISKAEFNLPGKPLV